MVHHILRHTRCLIAGMLCWITVNALADGASLTTHAALPPDVQVVWGMSEAFSEATATRERICINGLWRWQPAAGEEQKVPDGNCGYFKVPGPCGEKRPIGSQEGTA